MVRKIHVTGNAGAGKSTLTYELGKILNIPTYCLDSIVWKPGWTETDSERRHQLLEELVT